MWEFVVAGQKDVEELGRSAFSSNKVSQLVAKYVERGDEWMRSHSDYNSSRTGTNNSLSTEHPKTSASLNEVSPKILPLELLSFCRKLNDGLEHPCLKS